MIGSWYQDQKKKKNSQVARSFYPFIQKTYIIEEDFCFPDFLINIITEEDICRRIKKKKKICKKI